MGCEREMGAMQSEVDWQRMGWGGITLDWKVVTLSADIKEAACQQNRTMCVAFYHYAATDVLYQCPLPA